MNDKTYYEPGTYRCQITRQAMCETSTGKPQFVLSFMVNAKVDPNDPDMIREESHQYERSMFRVITDKTIPYFLEDLEQLGFTGESFLQLDPENAGCVSFTGLVMDFFCTHETYQETTREKWGLAREGGFTTEPLDQKGLRRLDAMFGKELKKQAKTRPLQANPESVGKGLPPKPASSDTSNRDNEIPF